MVLKIPFDLEDIAAISQGRKQSFRLPVGAEGVPPLRQGDLVMVCSDEAPEKILSFLVVTEVHRERLFDLTEASALLEGIDWPDSSRPFCSAADTYLRSVWPKIAYEFGGEALLEYRNPWVFVVHFRPIITQKEALYYAKMLKNCRKVGNYETI